ANALGTGLYVSQELLWNEQRIIPKFSFHTTSFAQQNRDKFGSSFSEQILKDYNGQTYWLSANLASFLPNTSFPKWLNVAIGYGADGMLYGNAGMDSRERQFYISFDINFQKIQTNNSFLRTIFSIINTLKVPAPTLSYSSSKGLKAHSIYF
ncbi:MAG: DUF2279 domain-containing protein, partial [Flavobacterium sp.]